MICPDCKTRSKILRTSVNKDKTAREEIHICKNIECGTIFRTYNEFLNIVAPHKKTETSQLDLFYSHKNQAAQ